jgi:hypothetical protein
MVGGGGQNDKYKNTRARNTANHGRVEGVEESGEWDSKECKEEKQNKKKSTNCEFKAPIDGRI